MFLKSIKINADIVLDSLRPQSQAKRFKIKKKARWVADRSKPILCDHTKPYSRAYDRYSGYEKKKIYETFFTIHKKNFELVFKQPITVIVGDNGCGKSHLLKYLELPKINGFMMTEEDKKEEYKKWLSNDIYTLSFLKQPTYYIFENKIHKTAFVNDHKNSTNPNKSDFNSRLVALWDMEYDSNGESTLDFINSIKEVENSLIILDEPETSLSIKSQIYVHNVLKELSERGSQIILITHSQILMRLTDKVFDFEKKKYRPLDKYWEEQMKGFK